MGRGCPRVCIKITREASHFSSGKLGNIPGSSLDDTNTTQNDRVMIELHSGSFGSISLNTCTVVVPA
jgi:hypothetical protein